MASGIVMGAPSSSSSSSSSSKKAAALPIKRFEIKKWNAVSLWAWGHISLLITVPSAGIISWISALNAKLIRLVLPVRSALLLGACAIMLSISTASADGSKLVKCVLLIIASGSFRSMATRSCSSSSSQPNVSSSFLEVA